MNEITMRMAVDLGVPILSANQLIQDASNKFETDPEFNHPFYAWINEHVKKGDHEKLNEEKILLKLLRLNPSYQEGFIMTDWPTNIA